ncbi:MAG: AsmA-like C-terminal domain-containing protein [Deltaproteobacteria bacterium]|nr:AsmA-like C-terminal domain-containing protein [Candidatus Anaeroferrophillacea bacterium]
MRFRIVRLTVRLGTIGIFLFFLFLLALPNLVDLDNYRDVVVAVVERRCAATMAIRHLRLYVGRTVGVKVVGPTLDGGDGRLAFAAEAVLVGLDIAELLHRRVKLSSVHFVRPELRVVLDRDGGTEDNAAQGVSLTTGGTPRAGNGPAGGDSGVGKRFAGAAGGFFTWCQSFERLRVVVYDGRVTVTDRIYAASPVTTSLNDVDLDARLGSGDRLAPFELTATVGTRGAGGLDISGYIGHCGWPIDWGGVAIDCRVKAENLDADAYWPYYSDCVPMQKIGGRVDIAATYAGDLTGHFHSRGRITVRHGVLAYRQVFGATVSFERLAVGYDFELGERYDTIRIDDVELDIDGVRVAGSCRLDDVRSGAAGRITARVTAGRGGFEGLTGLLPWEIMPDFVGAWWRRHRPRGILVVEEAHLAGTYREIAGIGRKPVPPELLGARVRLKDAGRYEEPLVPAGRVELWGAAALAGDRLELPRLDLRLGFHARQKWRGRIIDLFRDPVMEMHGELEGRLEEVLPVLHGWRPEFPPLVGLRAAAGSLRATVEIRDRLAVAGVDDWRVDCRPDGASFYHERIGAPVERLWGGFEILPAGIRFTAVSGKIAGAPLVLDGTIRGRGFADAAAEMDLAVSSPALTPAAVALLPPVATASSAAEEADFAAMPSTCQLRFQGVMGRPETWCGDGTLAVHGWDFRLAGFAPFFEDVTLEVECAGTRVDFRRLRLRRGDSDLAGRGFVDLTPAGADFSLDLHSRRWNNADMKGDGGEAAPLPAGASVGDEAASADMSLAVVPAGVPSPLAAPLGWLGEYCRRGDLRWAVDELLMSRDGGEPLRFEGVELDAGWAGGELAVRRLAGSREDSDVTVTGRLAPLANGRVSGRFTVRAARLEWGEAVPPDDEAATAAALPGPGAVAIIPDPGPVAAKVAKTAGGADGAAAGVPTEPVSGRLRAVFERLAAAHDFELDFHIDNLRWKTVVAGEVGGRLQLDAGGVRMTDLNGRVWDGGAVLNGSWDRATGGCRLSLSGDDIDMQAANESLAIYPERRLPLSGRGTVAAELAWCDLAGDGWRETLDGSATLAVSSGSVRRFTLLANVLSLLNVSQLVSLRLPDLTAGGLPFTSITGTLGISGGEIHTDDLLLTGPALNLAAGGVISLPRRQVDLIIEAQPLQAVDRVLTAIPLVGYVIGGEGKRFIVVRLEVAGPFDRIRVEPAPLEGLTRQTGGIIKRLLQTPGRILHWPGQDGAAAAVPPSSRDADDGGQK